MIRAKYSRRCQIVSVFATVLIAAVVAHVRPAHSTTCEVWSGLSIGRRPHCGDAPAIWDPVRNTMLMFGGVKQLVPSGEVLLNDVVRLDPNVMYADGLHWDTVLAFGVRPTPRFGSCAVYDPVRDRMIVFGGNTGTLPYSNEVWTFNLSNDTGTWAPLVAAGTPPSGRFRCSMIYDPIRDRLLVFGGIGPASVYFDEVWELTLSGTPTWSLVATLGTAPPARGAHVAIYDPLRDRMLVYGGDNGATYFKDLWALSLGATPTWSLLQPVGNAPPWDDGGSGVYAPPRGSVVYDPAHDRMIFTHTGGSDPYTLTYLALRFDPPLWIDVVPTGAYQLPTRGSIAAVYAPDVPRVLMVGGEFYNLDGFFVGTYSLDLSGPAIELSVSPPNSGTIAQSPGISCQAPGGQVTLTAIPNPGFRFVEWVGDVTRTLNPQTVTMAADKVVLARFELVPLCEQWAPFAPTPQIQQRTGAASIWDPVRHRMIMFGGYDGVIQGYANDVQTLNGAPGSSWTPLEVTGTPPSARDGSCAVYDPVRDRMILYSGNNGVTPYSNQTWMVSLSGSPTWAPLFSGPPPPASLLPTVIYDPVRDRLLVFGGSGPGPVFYNDVWQLTLSGTRAWSLVATAGTRPAGRYAHRALYDPVRDRMVVYGGENGSTKFTDLWALTLSGTPTWTQLQAVGKPPAPHLPGAVYDPVADRAVFYGGNDWIGFSGGYNGDPSHRTTSLALKFDPPLWIDLPTTNPPPPTNPPPLNWQAIVYDPDVPRILMASGWQDNQILPVDTYALDLSEGLSLDLDVNDATMGAVTQEPSSCHAAGDKVVVEAVARPGYEFVEWLGDLSGNANPASITMDGYKSVLARFREVSVATLMTVFEAVPVEHGIEIRWQFGTPGDVASVSVERALQLEGPWTRVEAAQTSRGDLMVAMDRGASTGTTYFYRLVLDLRQGGQTTAGPVASVAAAPLISDLTLLSPNPTRGGVDVDFAVARGGVVRISVLDIAGRERAVLARGTYPAGLHALRWDGRIGGAKAAAGIYFMRFEGPGQTRVKRLVML